MVMEGARVLLLLGLVAASILTLHTASCRPSAVTNLQSRRHTGYGGRDEASEEVFGGLGGLILSQLVRLITSRLGANPGSPAGLRGVAGPSSPAGQRGVAGGQQEGGQLDDSQLLEERLMDELRELLGDTETPPAQEQTDREHQARY